LFAKCKFTSVNIGSASASKKLGFEIAGARFFLSLLLDPILEGTATAQNPDEITEANANAKWKVERVCASI
jgi:hypothetical protein